MTVKYFFLKSYFSNSQKLNSYSERKNPVFLSFGRFPAEQNPERGSVSSTSSNSSQKSGSSPSHRNNNTTGIFRETNGQNSGIVHDLAQRGSDTTTTWSNSSQKSGSPSRRNKIAGIVKSGIMHNNSDQRGSADNYSKCQSNCQKSESPSRRNNNNRPAGIVNSGSMHSTPPTATSRVGGRPNSTPSNNVRSNPGGIPAGGGAPRAVGVPPATNKGSKRAKPPTLTRSQSQRVFPNYHQSSVLETECELERLPKIRIRDRQSKFRTAPPIHNKDLCEEHLIIYERQTSVFNPLSGMTIMKVRSIPAMDPRLKQSKPEQMVTNYHQPNSLR